MSQNAIAGGKATNETLEITLPARRGERITAEIGHILFLDLVGFSRLSLEEQNRNSRELRAIVRATPEFQNAEARRELIGSDTGDGMALIFFRDPLAPVQCAVEIAHAVQGLPHLHLRMGIHSGPVTRVPDINNHENVSGNGINMAQRVMESGDSGHILLSAVAADMVRAFEAFNDCLTDLGELPVKHGAKVHLFNLVCGDIGNKFVPSRVRAHGSLFVSHSWDEPIAMGDKYRAQVGTGKTISLVYKRRGAPLDERLGKLLEAELAEYGFTVKTERHQPFGPAWISEVEAQFTASDAVVFLFSDAACISELFEYELKTASAIAIRNGGKTKLLALRVGYENELTDIFRATFAQTAVPLWRSPADDEAAVQHILSAFVPLVEAKPDTTRREKAGGAVPLDSAYYIVRPTDDEFAQAIARHDSIVLVKGGRQMGKTSLLARGLQGARASGAKVVSTDLQTLSAPDFRSADALYRALAELIADQLDLDVLPGAVWNDARSANLNLERYLRREVLGTIGADTPLVWGLDEVDRLFGCDFGSEVFGLFRSWHNKRSLDPTGPWSRLTLVIAYATEAHLFITDMNQSPFNVGTRLVLEDFSPREVSELNTRYDSPMREKEVGIFYDLLGGQPYLTRRGLDELTTGNGLTFERFAAEAGSDEGVFGDHLRRMYLSLSQEPVLKEAMRLLLQHKPCPSTEAFYRLRTAGFVCGDTLADATVRCRVYEDYLSRHL